MRLRRVIAQIVCIVAVLFTLSGRAWADDTDVYLHAQVASGAEPLVMFILDYRSNLGSTVSCDVGSTCDELRVEGYLTDAPAGSGDSTTFFDMLRAVFKKVLTPLDNVKVGFMLNHQNVNNCAGPTRTVAGCSNGAYILQGFTDDKSILFQKLDAVRTPGGTLSHPYQGKEAYFELFRYLTGQDVYNGHNGFEDFGEPPNTTTNLDVNFPDVSWDTNIETPNDKTYLSPLANATNCVKIFVINIMFQVSQQEDDSDAAIMDTKANGGMAGIDLASDNSFDTVIRYMDDVDLADGTFGTAPDLDGKQNVVSYFVVDPSKINKTTVGYANAGGTGTPLALSSDPAVLIDELNSIFKSILSVSTTFVAPSVPVNVFNRAQISNEVFMALFQADPNGYPLWTGNLKKLVIAPNPTTGALELQDVNGVNAIDIDGRIKPSALTFWTDPSTLPPPNTGEVAGADGRSVTRGGAGQKTPGFVSGSPGLQNTDTGARQLFTEDSTNTATGLMPLDADASTATSLWSYITQDWSPAPSSTTYTGATSTEQDEAINDLRFARGLAGDVTTDSTTKRAWMMGDPLHSRPLPINYGARGSYTTSNPDIRILMATNDGFMHMFTDTTSSGTQSGAEAWAFIPRKAIPMLDRLRNDTAGTPIHPSTVDGSPSALIKDLNGDGTIDAAAGDKVYVYFGMRRGGKTYYALDVSNPDAPRLLWSISNTDPGFSELAQTWSTPQVGKINLGNGPIDVIVFGGGYHGDDGGDHLGDLGKDAANIYGESVAPGTDDSEGNAVYVVNALTGQLIWKAVGGTGTAGYLGAGSKTYLQPAMKDSIPSDVAAIDTNGDGLIDRIYVGDTGGVVWRADLAGSDISTWTMTPILNIGRHFDSSSPSTDRRFFNRPDVVQARDQNGTNFDAVIIGSGDRANPLDTTVVNNFYMFKDINIVSGNPPTTTKTQDDLADLTSNCLQNNTCDSTTLTKLSSSGWYIQLGSGTGEKNLAPALTLGGKIFFTTFTPGIAGIYSCHLNEGSGKVYAVSLLTSEAVFNYNTSNDENGITLDRSDTLESGGIPVEVVSLGGDVVLVQGEAPVKNIQVTGAKVRWRTFWYDWDSH